jgi:tetratricopeptide (TPR) repeat protein
LIAAWDFSNGSGGLTANEHCRLNVTNGILTIDTTGNDPILMTPDFKAGPGRKELTLCARFRGTQQWQLFWKTTQESTSEQKSVRFDLDGGDGKWREHRVAFDPNPDLTGLRFDPAAEAGVHLELGWIMLVDYSAEAELQRAVEQAPGDPLAWIERGRLYAERGEREKADADFAKAASLTPHELNKFLEAGWWVVGPYPLELEESCPPETDADPSRPVHINDPKTGLSDAPVAWKSVLTGRWGRVDLSSLPDRRDNSSVYALAHVYSPAEQTKLLMVLRSQPLRVWINGSLVEDYAPGEYPTYPTFEPFHRVPVVLRAGRNSLLIKSSTADFTVRIGDTPRDRAVLLMEREQFTEALSARARMTAADREDQSDAVLALGELTVMLGTDQEYSEASRALLARARRENTTMQLVIAYYCAHRPNPVFTENAATLVAYVDRCLSQQPADWTQNYGALVHYRAGNFERSRALLDRSQSNGNELPLQALLAHQNGNSPAARTFLEEALKLAAEHETSLEQHNRSAFLNSRFVWWLEWAGFLTMLREAEQTIRGETTQSDALCAHSEAIAKTKWAMSPEMADFDHAILFGSIDSAGLPKFPQPFLARGRRLAELGRADEAEADFKKVAELRKASQVDVKVQQ